MWGVKADKKLKAEFVKTVSALKLLKKASASVGALGQRLQ